MNSEFTLFMNNYLNGLLMNVDKGCVFFHSPYRYWVCLIFNIDESFC